MSNFTQQKLVLAINQEICRKLLYNYFKKKGIDEDKLDKNIYPPILQDIVTAIPQLSNKIEIQPHIKDINPISGEHKLGWNMFILGINRIYLGESTHIDMNEVKTNLDLSGKPGLERITHTTPRKIIEFIVKTLGKSKDGLLSNIEQKPFKPLPISMDQSGYFNKRFT